MKSKILEQTVKITKKQFIDEVFGSQELQNAMDTGQVEFVTNLRFTIKLKIQEINKEHTVRATLDRHFTHKLDAEDMPIELVALSRLMTTSLKRSNKNILEHPSVLGSKKSEHTRKISFADAEVMEVQLLQQSGSRSDQVVMDTIGHGSSYLNIALTIEAIKANIKGVSEKK